MNALITATTNTLETMSVSIHSTHSRRASAASSLVGAGHVSGFEIRSRFFADTPLVAKVAKVAEVAEVAEENLECLNKPDTVWSGMHTRTCFTEEGDSGIEGHRP